MSIKHSLFAMAACCGIALSNLTACATEATYNPDNLPAGQYARVAGVCQNVMGLSPDEHLEGGYWMGSDRLDYWSSHYRGCIVSLSDSLQNAMDNDVTQQADADCRAKGYAPGSPDLALCVLNSVNRPNPAPAKEAAVALTPVSEKLPTASGSFIYASPHDNARRLFAANGERVAGNLDSIPASLRTNGRPLEFPPLPQFPTSARLLARRLPTGETLVVGRDISQLREMRSIITSALTWSGISILLVGLACGIALSAGPLKRLRLLQSVAHDIARGDLKRRMPTSQRGDELDMFASTVNHMMGEVERLMSEVKGATEVIAHDLLSPLAGATLQLRRLQHADQVERQEIARVAGRIEEVLERFRGILRIAELEVRHRRAGFVTVDLADLVAPVTDLYAPLAEAAGVRLLAVGERGATVEADPKLLFEAVSNLIDNAIKFGGRGSTVQVRVGKDAARPQLIVQDDGPGIPANERAAVLQRFYRAERNRPIPGSGLGLSVVAAIVRLHDFELVLEDADPGVRAIIECRPTGVTH